MANMRIDIKEEDWDKMKWNIRHVPLTEPITIRFPELKSIFLEYETGFEIGVDIDIVHRYIVYCYHKNSPLVKRVDDIIERKQYALMLCNISDFTDEGILKLIGNEGEKVIAAIIQFLKFERDMDYMAWCIQVETYYNWNQALLGDNGKSQDIKNRTEIFKNLESLRESISVLSERVTRGDTDIANHLAANQVLLKRSPVSMEEYSLQKKNN